MKITFILPCIGRKDRGKYIRGWLMEPLSISILSALTPAYHEKVFRDDRLDAVFYDDPTDMVCISAETYTARRAYQIAAVYRQKGIPVVMGGFHVTLNPEEATAHADAIVIGEAEGLWADLLSDAESGNLKSLYRSSRSGFTPGLLPDRSIYAGKKYIPLSLVETSRGCNFHCEFCSVSCFFHQRHSSRPIADVIADIGTLKNRNIFFTDDNIGMDRQRFKALLRALIPLKIRWAGQVSLHIAEDGELLRLMKESGCLMVLIGFESLNPDVLKSMHKSVNKRNYAENLKRFRSFGISIYATFVFGYEEDTEDSFRKTLAFALEHKFFFAAFNHLVPFPGTPLYERLKKEGRLINDPWWLSPEYRFGQVAFRPRNMSAERLSELCFAYRQKFYAFSSILKRGRDRQSNNRDLRKALIFFYGNISSKYEVHQRQALPLGCREV